MSQSDQTTNLHIEFDGAQLTVRTDVEDVAEFVRATYRHMLVDFPVSLISTLEIRKTVNGFSFRGDDAVDIDSDSSDPLVPYLKEEILSKFIRTRPDLLWIHAGAVEHNGRALLIAGPSGQGKSTLVTKLLTRGWRLMSDDVAPTRMDCDLVLPFYQLPSRRLSPGRKVSAEEVASLERECVAVPEAMLQRQPTPLRAVVFPVFVHGALADLTALSKGDSALELLRNVRNLMDHKSAAAEKAALLASEVPMFRLCYGSSDEAASCISRAM